MIATRSTISENRIRRLEGPRFSGDYLISGTQTGIVHDEWPGFSSRRSAVRHDDWLDTAREQLEAIGELTAGWNSYGADPPDAAAIQGAWSLLQSLHRTGVIPKPHLYPTPSGGIQLEWESAGHYLEIELLGETKAKYFFSDADGRYETEGFLEQDKPLDDVIKLICRFSV